MSDAKTYTVNFLKDARPGVLAVGGIKRGASAAVGAAEAVRLVDAKGLSFASAEDEQAARGEVAAVQAAAAAAASEPGDATPAEPMPDAAHGTLSEEH